MKDEQQLLEEAVLTSMRKNLGPMIGDPDLKFHQVDRNTRFGSDLELESIEFVVLAERLRAEFGAGVNFVDFLSTRTVEEVVSLRVGDVVQFVAESLLGNESTRESVTHG